MNEHLAPVNQYIEAHQISTTVVPLLLIATTILFMIVAACLWRASKITVEALIYWIFGNAPSFSAALEIIRIYRKIPKYRRASERPYWLAHRRYLERTLK